MRRIRPSGTRRESKRRPGPVQPGTPRTPARWTGPALIEGVPEPMIEGEPARTFDRARHAGCDRCGRPFYVLEPLALLPSCAQERPWAIVHPACLRPGDAAPVRVAACYDRDLVCAPADLAHFRLNPRHRFIVRPTMPGETMFIALRSIAQEASLPLPGWRAAIAAQMIGGAATVVIVRVPSPGAKEPFGRLRCAFRAPDSIEPPGWPAVEAWAEGLMGTVASGLVGVPACLLAPHDERSPQYETGHAALVELALVSRAALWPQEAAA
jgi:hypothetical protein